jgi:hypothetical protein
MGAMPLSSVLRRLRLAAGMLVLMAGALLLLAHGIHWLAPLS